jgi:DNA repair protein RadA/Sms
MPGIDRILGEDPVTKICGIAAKGGQAVQIFGEPGSGKSSMLLEIARGFTRQRYVTLYVAGEESLQQIKTRADRFGTFNQKMQMLEEQDLDSILYAIDDIQPTIVIIDSLNTVCVEDYTQGSATAMRIAAREIYKFTQSHGIGLFLVVQMDKTGTNYAGPKEVEHIVDTSLFLHFEGNKKNKIRRLDCDTKNRFGPTPSTQRFKMVEEGLVEIDEEAEAEPDPAPPIDPGPPTPTLRSVP